MNTALTCAISAMMMNSHRISMNHGRMILQHSAAMSRRRRLEEDRRRYLKEQQAKRKKLNNEK